VCLKSGRWEEALRLLQQEMPKRGVQPIPFQYKCAVQACEAAGRTEVRRHSSMIHVSTPHYVGHLE
jgi:pentatricopeptide repeat protein